MTWRSRDLKHQTPALSYQFDEATVRFALPPERDIRRTRTTNLALQSTDPKHAAAEALSKKETIRRYFHSTYEIYERIFECLSCDEAFWIPPVHKIRHPMIFYLGHTATFYINKLCLAGLTTRINQKFEEMFAIGVDEMSWDDLNEGHYDWPSVKEVWDYRRLVRDRINELLLAAPPVPLPLTFDNSTTDDLHSLYWCVMMGIEHERIHLETASVHLRELPLRLVRDNGFWPPCPTGATNRAAVLSRLGENKLVPFVGKPVRIGRAPDDPQYGWDCDYAHDVTIATADFQASERLVSNAEFFNGFMADGGYADPTLWDEEGWRWVTWKHPTHPWFWVRADGGESDAFKLRAQVEEIAMPWDWPVELNHLEARALVNYLSRKSGTPYRLPTEAEWIQMRDESVGHLGDQWQWPVGKAPGNINFELGFASSTPVDMFHQGRLYDVVGNAWQHCETPAYAYKGFSVHPFYDDFSLPTFDGRHRCMRGGTWISTGNEATRDARYAFRRHFFQFIGVRFITSATPVDEDCLLLNCHGVDPAVDLAAEESYDVVDEHNIRVKIHRLAMDKFAAHAQSQPKDRMLDILCGAGRSTFEFAKDFNEAIGQDFSARMLQPAFAIREKNAVSFSKRLGAGQPKVETVMKTSFAFSSTRHKAFFYQADPANLHAHMTRFDLIVSYRAIERTYAPQLHVAHIVGRLSPGGVAVIVSSFVAGETAKAHNQSFNLDALRASLGELGCGIVEGPTPIDGLEVLAAQGEPLKPVKDLHVLVVKKNAA